MGRSAQPPSDLHAHPFPLGEERLVLVSFPVDDPTAGLGLTEAQLAIFEMLRSGASLAGIASRRVGTSPSTVRNQVSALYRVLGVSGRSEFLGRFARAPAR